MGGIMLDLGANIGRMSISRVLLGDVQAAYCAEPDPLNDECLVRNVFDKGLSGLVLPDRAAVGAHTGTMALHQTRHSRCHTLVAGGRPTVGVPVITIDDRVAGLGIDPALVSFVKLDVQGWEAHVLAGASGVLARGHIAWQIAFKPPCWATPGVILGELLPLLRDRFA